MSSFVEIHHSPAAASALAEQASATQLPVWLYPQVLSLDTPAIAVAWQWWFAKAYRIPITFPALFLTAACVWMIYAADHLLDVHRGAIYSARHRFVQRHQRKFVVAFAIVFGAAAVASAYLPAAIWRGGLALSGVVALYLAAVHAGSDAARRYWPKEFVVGIVFAAGSSIATWTSRVAFHAIPEIALFAALCILNCSAVDYWEWQSTHVLLRYPHPLTRWVARRFNAAVVMIAAACGTAILLLSSSRAFLPALLSALLLMTVASARRSLRPEVLRLLADAALLTPLLLLLR